MSKKVKLSLLLLLSASILIIGIVAGAKLYKNGYIAKYKTEIKIFVKPILEKINNSKPDLKFTNLPITGRIYSNNYDFNRTEIKPLTYHRYGALEPFEKNLLYIDGQGGLF